MWQFVRDTDAKTYMLSPALDRIDSDKGYYKGNVQVVLTTVNLAKNKMSMESFKKVWKDILENWSALVDDPEPQTV